MLLAEDLWSLDMLGFFPMHYSSPKWQAGVPKEHGFSFHDGPVVTSLFELKKQLSQVTDASLAYHVHEQTHDIAAWIGTVIGDELLASRLREAKTRWDLIVTLEQYMYGLPDIPTYLAAHWLREGVVPSFNYAGIELSSMTSLMSVLQDASDEDLAYHWERMPNDLSRWLSDAVGDYELASQLEAHKPIARVISQLIANRLVQLRAYL